jgi:hypothetical protein
MTSWRLDRPSEIFEEFYELLRLLLRTTWPQAETFCPLPLRNSLGPRDLSRRAKGCCGIQVAGSGGTTNAIFKMTSGDSASMQVPTEAGFTSTWAEPPLEVSCYNTLQVSLASQVATSYLTSSIYPRERWSTDRPDGKLVTQSKIIGSNHSEYGSRILGSSCWSSTSIRPQKHG